MNRQHFRYEKTSLRHLNKLDCPLIYGKNVRKGGVVDMGVENVWYLRGPNKVIWKTWMNALPNTCTRPCLRNQSRKNGKRASDDHLVEQRKQENATIAIRHTLLSSFCSPEWIFMRLRVMLVVNSVWFGFRIQGSVPFPGFVTPCFFRLGI